MKPTPLRAVVWVGHIDPELEYRTVAVVIHCDPPDALDPEERGAFACALDGGVAVPPGVGFYVWTGIFQWYDDRAHIPDGETGCRVTGQAWRPAGALEVWAAQAAAKAYAARGGK